MLYSGAYLRFCAVVSQSRSLKCKFKEGGDTKNFNCDPLHSQEWTLTGSFQLIKCFNLNHPSIAFIVYSGLLSH